MSWEVWKHWNTCVLEGALPSIHTLLQTVTRPIQTPHVELSGPEGAQNPALAATRGTPRTAGGRVARGGGPPPPPQYPDIREILE